MLTEAPGSPALPVGRDPERIRLEQRARRLEQAIAALARLQDERCDPTTAPASLRGATATFSVELASVRRRLAALRAERRIPYDPEEV